ncbi:histidine phosphatase family protein [Bradyrhizobium sp. PUT101]|uniref:histidine phosphatase family protein n=1 Tax=Bradyrhizobium sp. PUT101 TaxID=3447427 RepID=UPI003F8672ED
MAETLLGATRLILVRHGEPDEGNPLDPGDPALTREGALQARRVAELLAGEGIDRIVSSPQRRARLTAHPLASLTDLPIEIVEGLAEVDLHTDRYRSPETIKREYPERWTEFLASPAAFFGKDEAEFNATVLRACEQLLASRARVIAVFSHGTPVKVLVQHALRLESRSKLRIGHCSLTRISGTTLADLAVECINDEYR